MKLKQMALEVLDIPASNRNRRDPRDADPAASKKFRDYLSRGLTAAQFKRKYGFDPSRARIAYDGSFFLAP
jgi:hypothetical protein